MPGKSLHIVDGESTGEALKASGLTRSTEILCWKDALYTGPVPAGLSLKELSQLRSQFWTGGKRRDEFSKRDAQLLTWRKYDEIVLWFGSTSVCQLSLAQILTREACGQDLATRKPFDAANVRIDWHAAEMRFEDGHRARVDLA